jgi:hypothetical protein
VGTRAGIRGRSLPAVTLPNIADMAGLKDRIVAINDFRPLMPNRDWISEVQPSRIGAGGELLFDRYLTRD